MVRVKLFTHTDLDGVGGAILANIAYGRENVDVEYCDYSNIDKRVLKFIESKDYENYDYALITDISVSMEVAQLISDTQPKTFKKGFHLDEMFQLLDHHNTAIGLNKFYWCKVGEYNNDELEDYKTSGTFMLYEYLLEREELIDKDNMLYKFANMVREYDTWEWAKTNNIKAKKLNDLFYILGLSEFNRIFTSKLESYINGDSVNSDIFSGTDLLLLNLEQNKIDKYINKKNKQLLSKNILDYKVGVIFAEQYISELGNELSERNPELDFIMIINLTTCKISYRTIKDNIDLGGGIAAHFGGGGHPKSAGSVLNPEILSKLIDLIVK